MVQSREHVIAYRPKRNEVAASYHKARREWAIEYLGGSCISCGTNEKLEFDHIDPKTKSFNIGNNLSAALDRLTDELDKCQLLCVSCHDKKTEAKHGTYSRYTNMKCRCEECKGAQRKYYNEKRTKRFKKYKPETSTESVTII